MKNLTVTDVKKIEKILNEVKYEYNNLPYDQIPWASNGADAIYKEVLNRL